MAQTWPSTITNRLQQSGFSYNQSSGVIRTDMETGPAKIRRRFTAVNRKYKGNIIMTSDQFNTFQTWFEVTLMMGTLTFMFPDPMITGSDSMVEMRFDFQNNPWSVTPSGETSDFQVTLNLEKVPS